jgi:hypothetical protein
MNAYDKYIHVSFFLDRPDIFTQVSGKDPEVQKEMGCWKTLGCEQSPTDNIFKPINDNFYFVNPARRFLQSRETKRIVIRKVGIVDSLNLKYFLEENLSDDLMKHLLFNIDILDKIFIA